MASSLKNLSDFEAPVPSAEGYKFAIAVADWNTPITSKLLDGAVSLLLKQGAKEEDIIVKHVPGTFELTVAAKWLADNTSADAVIVLGCVIQGETRHFDFICDAVSNGVTNVALQSNKPVIFGVLTPNDAQQAEDRAGGKHGNKGEEAGATAIRMAELRKELMF